MKQIILTRGKVAMVDDNDFNILEQWKWSCTANGYAYRNERGKRIYMHRQILDTPDNLSTDHIDRNKLNNCRYNLVICTVSNNNYNRSKYKNSSSKYYGVSKNSKETNGKRWEAFYTENNKKISLGLFYTEIYAALIYNEFAEIHSRKININTLEMSATSIYNKEDIERKLYLLSNLKGYYFHKRINKFSVNIRNEYICFSKNYISEDDAISKVKEIKKNSKGYDIK